MRRVGGRFFRARRFPARSIGLDFGDGLEMDRRRDACFGQRSEKLYGPMRKQSGVVHVASEVLTFRD